MIALPYLIAKSYLGLGIENRIESIKSAEAYFEIFFSNNLIIKSFTKNV